MKNNVLLSIIKFFIYLYLILLLIKLLFPAIVIFGIYMFIKYLYDKNKKTNKIYKKEIISYKVNDIPKKDEFKNYIINELYKLTEKCNSLNKETKIEYLNTINVTLDEFTKRYDTLINNSYKKGIVLNIDSEDSIKMDFISKVTKLESEIDNEIEKQNKKNVLINESSKLQSLINKKIKREENIGLVLSK